LLFAFSSVVFRAIRHERERMSGLPGKTAVFFLGSDIESVQVTNGNLHVDIPIWGAKGRGLDYLCALHL